MRKLLLGFILGFFFILGYSLTVSAQALPVPDPSLETLTTIQTGNEQLINISYVPEKLLPWNNFSSNFSFGFNSGAVLYSELTEVTPEHFNVVRLTTEDKQELLSVNPFWSSVNNLPTEFTVNDEIFLCSFDNGYMRGNCYIDQNGNILSYSNTLAGKYLNLAIGGNQVDVSEFNALFSDQVDQILSNNLSLYDSGDIDITDASFYYFWGQVVGGNPNSAGYLYIPNQYNPGVIVPETSTEGASIKYWLCNDSSAYVYKNVLGNFNQLSVTQGTFTKNGITYSMRIGFSTSNSGNNLTPNNTYENWSNHINVNNRCFAKSGYFYNSSIEYQNSVAFKPLQYPSGSTLIPLSGNFIDYNKIHDLEIALNNLNSSLNELYDYTQSLGDNNFPFYYPYNDPIDLGESSLPLPGGSSFPDIGPQPIPSPILDYEAIPQPGLESTVQSFDALNIPFFRNLQYKFPFSIPWDIAQAIQNLGQRPEAPAWNFDWKIHILDHDYVYHFEGDLSDFDDLASMFRLLQFLAFVIFMGYFSYKQFF